eukprot:484314-Pyramimonas_sp.AAC.1
MSLREWQRVYQRQGTNSSTWVGATSSYNAGSCLHSGDVYQARQVTKCGFGSSAGKAGCIVGLDTAAVELTVKTL